MTAIFTPRACINALLDDAQANKPVCTYIPYRGFMVNIAMDSNHGDGDLSRSDITVFDGQGNDVTFLVLPEFGNYGMVPATGETLKETFESIDELVAVPA